MPILLAVIAALCWGVGDFAGGVAATKENNACVTVTREFVEVIVAIVVALIIGGHMSGRDFWLSVGIGLTSAVSLPLFYKALADGAMAVVAPVAGVTAAFVPVVVGLATGDDPSGWQVAGMVAAILGIGLVSLEPHRKDEPHGLKLAEDVGIAFVIGLLFAAALMFTHYTSNSSKIYPAVIASAVICLAMVVFGILTNSRLVPKRSSLPILVSGALIDITAYGCFIYSTRSGLLSITSVVASSYPAITAVCAAVFLHEHLSVPRRAGLVVSAAALGLLSIT